MSYTCDFLNKSECVQREDRDKGQTDKTNMRVGNASSSLDKTRQS